MMIFIIVTVTIPIQLIYVHIDDNSDSSKRQTQGLADAHPGFQGVRPEVDMRSSPQRQRRGARAATSSSVKLVLV